MKEFIGSVNYYGAGNIFRKYCGYSSQLPLSVSIQHGWTLLPTHHDALKNVGENWYWSKEMELAYKQAFPGIKTRAVGAPFLYHLKNVGYLEKPLEQRKGSIVFPAHSSKYVSVDFNYEMYAYMLNDLPVEYKPLTICIYHLDQENGMDLPFSEKGFTVVTNGSSLYQEDFLYNFVYNTRDKRYAFSNDPTSALIYASLMGLTSFFYGPEVNEFLVDNPPLSDRLAFEQKYSIANHWQMYFRFPDCDLNKQKEYCNLIAGKDVLLEKQTMKSLLYKNLFSRGFYLRVLISFLTHYRLTHNIYQKIKKIYLGKQKQSGETNKYV